MRQVKVNHVILRDLAQESAAFIRQTVKLDSDQAVKVYAVPRGGIPAALALASFLPVFLVDDPFKADIIYDDIIDSGRTRLAHEKYGHKPFFALIDKTGAHKIHKGEWIIFPWEHNDIGSFEDAITRILQFVGEDATRGGLKETPARVVNAWKHWCSGYDKDPKDILKVFEDGGERYDQMITVKDIPIYSHCEHHLAAIIGTVTISYIPNGKIVGLSKLSRLADMYARRLQVQERMTDQIADALFNNLDPKGVGVFLRARHLCMESRGVCQQGHHTITTALRGCIAIQPSAKAEFLRLAQ